MSMLVGVELVFDVTITIFELWIWVNNWIKDNISGASIGLMFGSELWALENMVGRIRIWTIPDAAIGPSQTQKY